MTPEELEIGKQLLNQTQMILGQGWDVLVYGTVVSNALYLISALISLIIGAFVIYNYNKRSDEVDAMIIGVLIGLSIFLVLTVLARLALGVICPEYTIMQYIMGQLSLN